MADGIEHNCEEVVRIIIDCYEGLILQLRQDQFC